MTATNLPPINGVHDLQAVVARVGSTAAGRAHAIEAAQRLDLADHVPAEWSKWVSCPECPGRRFPDAAGFIEHAEKVHTFSDIQTLVGRELREKYGRSGTATKEGIYVWTEDMTEEWVVYQVDGGDDEGLFQVTYSIDESDNVSFGEPVPVVRRTVYDAVEGN